MSSVDKYSEIEAAFRAYVQNRTVQDKVDKGWFTARDMAKQKRFHLREAQRAIRVLVDKGLVFTKKFMINTGVRVYPVLHYKLKTYGKTKKKTS